MGINEQLKLGGGGGSASIFARDIKYRFLSGKEAIPFRILPAFPSGHIAGRDDSMAWVSFRIDDDTLSDWCIYAHIARFIGHGTAYPSRKDFVSSLNFSDGGDCILTKMYHVAKSNHEWRYLVTDTKDAAGKQIRAPLSLPLRMLICNIVDIEKAPNICTLGAMSVGAAYSFLNPQKGWAYMRAVNVSAEVRAASPMAAWYLGDFTDPTNGIRFRMVKGTKNGDMSAYEAQLDMDAYGRVAMHQATLEQMKGRYILTEPGSYLNRQTNEELVEGLVTVFNEVSPSGKHETEFLRLALPEYAELIPAVATSVYTGIPRSMQPGFVPQPGMVQHPVGPAGPAPDGQYGQPVGPQYPQFTGVQQQPPSAPWVGTAPAGQTYSQAAAVAPAPMPPPSLPAAAAMPPAQAVSGVPSNVPGISPEAAAVNFAKYRKDMEAKKAAAGK